MSDWNDKSGRFYGFLDSARKNAARAGETASAVAYMAGKQTESMLNTAKLNVKILEKRGAVRDAFQELGEILYATHTGTPSDSDVLLEKLQAIDGMMAEIAQMEIAAGKAEQVRACPDCGAEAEAGDTFCRKCGAKL